MVGCRAVGLRALSFLIAALYIGSVSPHRKLTDLENLKLQLSCGRSTTIPSEGDVKIPWAVRIVSEKKSCSGTLISQWHLVTSAQCILHEWNATTNSTYFPAVDPSTAYGVYGGSMCMESASMKEITMKPCRGSNKPPKRLEIRGVYLSTSSYDYITGAIDSSGHIRFKDLGLFYSDFAIFELEKPIDLNGWDVRPACALLNPIDNETLSHQMHVFGFGTRAVVRKGTADLERENGAKEGRLVSEVNDAGGLSILESELENVKVSNVELDCEEVRTTPTPATPMSTTPLNDTFKDFASMVDGLYLVKSGEFRVGCKGYLRSIQPKSANFSGDIGGGLIANLNGRDTLVGVLNSGDSHCDPSASNCGLDESLLHSRMDAYRGFLCYFIGICSVRPTAPDPNFLSYDRVVQISLRPQNVIPVYKLSEEDNRKLQRTCGRPFSADDGNDSDGGFKIHGGDTVRDGEAPWAVKLLKFGSACTGTLISRWHFVTAAHCVINRYILFPNETSFAELDPTIEYIAYGGSPCVQRPAGEDFFSGFNCMKPCFRSNKTAQRLRIKAVVLPKSSYSYFKKVASEWKGAIQFTNDTFFSDMAIFELEEPIPDDSPNIRPACFPQKVLDTAPHDIPMRVYGFGKTEPDDGTSVAAAIREKIASADENIIGGANAMDIFKCSHIWDSADLFSMQFFANLTPSCSLADELPARRKGYFGYFRGSYNASKGKALCGGDSGSGLIANLNGRSTIMGAVSTGSSPICGDASDARKVEISHFTRMDLYIDFVCYHLGICPLKYRLNVSDVDDAVYVSVNTQFVKPTPGLSPDPVKPTNIPASIVDQGMTTGTTAEHDISAAEVRATDAAIKRGYPHEVVAEVDVPSGEDGEKETAAEIRAADAATKPGLPYEVPTKAGIPDGKDSEKETAVEGVVPAVNGDTASSAGSSSSAVNTGTGIVNFVASSLPFLLCVIPAIHTLLLPFHIFVF